MGKKLQKFIAGTSVLSATAIGFTALAGADIYTVKSGDTLWDIARNNGTTVEQLMKDNNLTSSLIFPGDQLSFQTTANQVASASSNGNYRVVFGDTLYKIASKFGTTVDNLVAINKIANPNIIIVGQNLVINANATTEVAPATSPVVVKKDVATPLAPVVKKEVVKETTSKPTVVAPVKQEETKAATPAPAKQEETKAATPAPAKQEETKAATPAPAKQEVAKAAAPAGTPLATSNKAAAIFAAAQAQLGRYQDCTLLVTNSLRAVGINFHDWPAGYLSLGTVVPANQAVPGDLVYYANGGMGLAHIAVYAGNGQAIHGGWNGNQTVLTTVNVGSGPVFIRVR